MNKNLKTKNNNKGFSIIEVVIYFSILTIVSVAVVGNIISLFKNYNIIRANQDIEYNAIGILDKLTRDVRDASSVDTVESSFSVAQGVVSLNMIDSSGDTDKIKFYLNNNQIKYDYNSVFMGNLSAKNVSVSSFRVYYINSSSTEALKVELNLEVTPHLSTSPISKNFYTTIQVRE